MENMEKTYSPSDIENYWYNFWEKHNYFKAQAEGEPFCIMLPPPNVTGSLHMGHGFQHTLIDALIRYKRMSGHKTLWQPGTDHAGISTQLVIEGQLAKLGKTRKMFSREAFVDEIWAWKKISGDNITKQMRELGVSTDWTRERFTMDEGLSEAVLKVFVQLYDDGLIYKGNRLVNWDPKLGTAVSDLEVINTEEAGHLWYIKYPIIGTKEHIVIATTRPETLFGDLAVAVHPEDERYAAYIGKYVCLPISNREIPIIADESIDIDFGTGAVKITPAHDFNDYKLGVKHNLGFINIFTKQATLNDNAPLEYQDLDRFVARKKVITNLKALDLLLKTQEHQLKVPRGEKSNEIIEPLLTEQWYVKTKILAEKAMQVVKNEEISFLPTQWTKTYFNWMENIEDWCISRQLWWGHRVPAWYDNEKNVYVGYSEEDVRFKYKLEKNVVLTQDEDVLDTWFSSALWPFSSLGWPEKTKELETFYPTSVLFTGFDIIFFWVARMIMFGLYFTGKVPFKQVVITGLICDADGKKMSKSKGNVLDPLDIIHGIDLAALIEKRTANLVIESVKDSITKSTRKQFPQGIKAYGTDALRFTFCAMASYTRVVRFDIQRVEGYRNFCNKLWNASRYVWMNVQEHNIDLEDGAFQYSSADLWILSRLQDTIESAHAHFAAYRFDLLANTLYDFVWHEYCDWYLELSKYILYHDNVPAMKRGTRRTLIVVLDKILKLLHPIMPYITEDIWQKTVKIFNDKHDSIMLCAYPTCHKELLNPEIEEDFVFIKNIVQTIRNLRNEANVAPSKSINLIVKNTSSTNMQKFTNYKDLICYMSKIQQVEYLDNDAKIANNAFFATTEGFEIYLVASEVLNVSQESEKLKKELDNLNYDIDFVQKKLNNKDFVSKAPAHILEKERQKLADLQDTLEKRLNYAKMLEL